MRLLEVVRAKKTGKDVPATVMQLGKRLKKVKWLGSATASSATVLSSRHPLSLFLIDDAHRRSGRRGTDEVRMAMGPFAMFDMAGVTSARSGSGAMSRSPTSPTAALATASWKWAGSGRRPARVGTAMRPAAARRS
jgi:3-hydroxyacyl-CoA dehydrogenase